MLRIEDGFIYLTRGDTAYLNVDIVLEDGSAYPMTPADKLTLSLKKSITDTDYALSKTIQGTTKFSILPLDTKPLEYGKYLFDVQLTTAKGEVFTIIEKSNFYIKEEVTE